MNGMGGGVSSGVPGVHSQSRGVLECLWEQRPLVRNVTTFLSSSFAAGYATVNILGVLLPSAENNFSR